MISDFGFRISDFFAEWGENITIKKNIICPLIFLFQKEEKEIRSKGEG